MEKFKAKQLIKPAVLMTVTIGVGKVVDHIVKEHSPVGSNIVSSSLIRIGGLALSAYITSKVTNSIEEEIDKATELLKTTFKEAQEKMKEEEINNETNKGD